MRVTRHARAVFLCGALVWSGLAGAQSTDLWRSWNEPVEPFRIVDNIYYVGANGIASFLITTPEGHILLDGGFQETATLIRDSISKLGFRLEDVQILLNSHAHFDHCGGLAELAEASGARVVISEPDAGVIESGGTTDFFLAETAAAHFPATEVDRRIRDKEQVRLGGVSLTAQLTAGHTRGCTSWTMKVEEDGRPLDVVFVCSTTILPEYRLLREPSYDGIAADFEATFERLKSLPCDVFLAPHAGFFRMADKLQRLKQGGTNPFVDPDGYREYVERGERKLHERLEQERRQTPGGGS